MPGYKQQVMDDTVMTPDVGPVAEPLARPGARPLAYQAPEAPPRTAPSARTAPAESPPAVPEPAVGPRRHVATLMDTIEEEVIPRLVLARRLLASTPADAAAPAPPRRPVTHECVIRLRDGLLANAAVDHFLSELLSDGVTVDQIFSDLMAPCARELGLMWERDEANFAEVTLSLGRLQQLLRELSYDFVAEVAAPGGQRRVMLASPPGEQHTFGVLMVAEYFRRDGWEVLTMPLASQAELEDAVRGDWFAVAGLSAGSMRRVETMTTMIRALRKASLNPALQVMVGGAAFSEQPELVARVGADAWAADARSATQQAERMLGSLAAPGRS